MVTSSPLPPPPQPEKITQAAATDSPRAMRRSVAPMQEIRSVCVFIRSSLGLRARVAPAPALCNFLRPSTRQLVAAPGADRLVPETCRGAWSRWRPRVMPITDPRQRPAYVRDALDRSCDAVIAARVIRASSTRDCDHTLRLAATAGAPRARPCASPCNRPRCRKTRCFPSHAAVKPGCRAASFAALLIHARHARGNVAPLRRLFLETLRRGVSLRIFPAR